MKATVIWNPDVQMTMGRVDGVNDILSCLFKMQVLTKLMFHNYAVFYASDK